MFAVAGRERDQVEWLIDINQAKPMGTALDHLSNWRGSRADCNDLCSFLWRQPCRLQRHEFAGGTPATADLHLGRAIRVLKAVGKLSAFLRDYSN